MAVLKKHGERVVRHAQLNQRAVLDGVLRDLPHVLDIAVSEAAQSRARLIFVDPC